MYPIPKNSFRSGMFHALPGLDVNRLLLATFRCELCLGPATLDPLYRVIVWSLNAARWRNLPWWTQNKPTINLGMVFINHNVGSCLCLGLSRNWQQLIYIYIRLARGFKKDLGVWPCLEKLRWHMVVPFHRWIWRDDHWLELVQPKLVPKSMVGHILWHLSGGVY